MGKPLPPMKMIKIQKKKRTKIRKIFRKKGRKSEEKSEKKGGKGKKSLPLSTQYMYFWGNRIVGIFRHHSKLKMYLWTFKYLRRRKGFLRETNEWIAKKNIGRIYGWRRGNIGHWKGHTWLNMIIEPFILTTVIINRKTMKYERKSLPIGRENECLWCEICGKIHAIYPVVLAYIFLNTSPSVQNYVIMLIVYGRADCIEWALKYLMDGRFWGGGYCDWF